MDEGRRIILEQAMQNDPITTRTRPKFIPMPTAPIENIDLQKRDDMQKILRAKQLAHRQDA